MSKNVPDTKTRILDAANRLFYAEGIRATSVDAIAEKAGVTKRTLYYHFKSKDDLITQYLQARDQPNLVAFKKWFDAVPGTIAEKTRAIFTGVARSSRRPGWRGCGFLRTAAELANMPGHPAVKVGAAHKKRFEAWLQSAFEAAGIAEAQPLARHVVLLMDGAFSTMLVHRDPAYIEAAGDAAAALVSSASTEGHL
jgi:AcrR family transcriptional regulator